MSEKDDVSTEVGLNRVMSDILTIVRQQCLINETCEAEFGVRINATKDGEMLVINSVNWKLRYLNKNKSERDKE